MCTSARMVEQADEVEAIRELTRLVSSLVLRGKLSQLVRETFHHFAFLSPERRNCLDLLLKCKNLSSFYRLVSPFPHFSSTDVRRFLISVSFMCLIFHHSNSCLTECASSAKALLSIFFLFFALVLCFH